jgi:DNA-binding XRE family transcriptional regulator
MSKLKQYREQKCISQRDLAEKASVTQQTIHSIETGKVEKPNWVTLRKLAIALEIEPKELLS